MTEKTDALVLDVISTAAPMDATHTVIVEKIQQVFTNPVQRVLLIQPPQFPEELLDVKIAQNKRYYNYPPYGLGLLCTRLKAKGYDVQILDLNFDLLDFISTFDGDDARTQVTRLWQNSVRGQIEACMPDLVGISCMFTMSHEITKKIVSFTKALRPDVPVIAGGVHITNAPDIILNECPDIDFVSLYESDLSFGELLDYVNGRGQPEALGQIGTLIDDQYVSLAQRSTPSAEDLNVIPDYLDLEIGRYSSLGEIGSYRYWVRPGSRNSSVLGNRGCRAHCSFCCVRHFNGNGVRSRSIASVVDEIEQLVTRYHINHISWLDDDIFFDPERTLGLFDEIIARDLDITWDATNGIIVSAAVVRPQILEKAVASGMIAANFGVESGSPEILARVHKPSGISHYKKLGPLLRQYPQVFARAFLIIGFPNETFGQILQTVDICQEMQLDWHTIQKLTPLPSTEIYEQMVDEGLIQDKSLNLDKELTLFAVRESEKQRRREKGLLPETREFVDYFRRDLDAVPTPEELDDLWLLVDYKVNYEKILTERDPLRLKKMQCFLKDVSHRMSIDNPLSTLFVAIVEHKLGNLQEAEHYLNRSKRCLDTSPYWQKRFDVLEINGLYDLCAYTGSPYTVRDKTTVNGEP